MAEEEKDKPVFDEQTLAKLLEAAFVLQEHNLELKKLELNLELQSEQIRAREQQSPAPQRSASHTPASPDDYTVTLAQIVETQRQIQARRLELDHAMALVAVRVMEIAKAGGAAIGLLEGKKIVYQAVAGQMTPPSGAAVPMEKALCVASLRTGQVIRCADVNAEFLLDVEECQRRGIQSMIAVPVYHEAETAGGLELYYGTTHAFTEQDVHSCQLMAGLITEALSRNEELTMKKSLASERAVMKEALNKLKPNVAAPAEGAAKGTLARSAAAVAPASSAAKFVCRKCGHRLMGEEQFCGKCGTPRSSNHEPADRQDRVASPWPMQQVTKKSGEPAPTNGASSGRNAPSIPEPPVERTLSDSIEEEMPDLFVAPQLRAEDSIGMDGSDPINKLDEDPAKPVLTVTEEPFANEDAPVGETALVRTGQAWGSAVTARDFLEQLAGANQQGGLARFWNARRGDIYLAIAVIFVAGVIRWGIWSSHPVSATGGGPTATASGHRKADPEADLSFFDRMLISMGLAETPPTPEDKGNPDTQVWVDLHTALYYCPGADLYGKTPKGKFTSQRDAQLDQYEPALRKVCE